MPDSDPTYCNARTRGHGDLEKVDPGPHEGDGYCKQQTDGGRCRMHGRDAGPPAKHGLYSGRKDDLQARFEEAFGDDKIGSMRAEIAALKALLSDFWERIDGADQETIESATKLQAEIRKSLNTASKIEKRHAVTEEEINALETGMVAIINRYVAEDLQKDAYDELERIVGDGQPDALKSGRAGG
jgi:hypothetical protein